MTETIRARTTVASTPDRASAPGTTMAPSACCGGPAPAGTDGCCARDAAVKASGGGGCGCGSSPVAAKWGCC